MSGAGPVPGVASTPAATDAELDEARLRMIWNEQRKLEAMFINNLGVAVMVTGAITPVLASLFGVSSAPALSWLTNGWLVVISVVVGFGLNSVATNWLRGLE